MFFLLNSGSSLNWTAVNSTQSCKSGKSGKDRTYSKKNILFNRISTFFTKKQSSCSPYFYDLGVVFTFSIANILLLSRVGKPRGAFFYKKSSLAGVKTAKNSHNLDFL